VEARGHEIAWAEVIGAPERLQRVKAEQDGKPLRLRSGVPGRCGEGFQTVGGAVPPPVPEVAPPQGRMLRSVPRPLADALSLYHSLRCHIMVLKMSEAFTPEEARRLACRLEIHPTPVHGSWLNMAETELSILG
jgi:hypothetical protein